VRTSILVRVSLAVATLAASTVWVAPAASANPVPFTDPNAHGYIGLCDKNGHQITSGNIGTAPLAVLAVSSAPAPAGYTAGYGKAVVNVYQPREGTEPGEWSGKGLTAGSTFTNTAHPMAEGTGLDPALVDFTSVFIPKWDGLVQLRMYFGAINRPEHTIPYPATVLQVKGNTWTVVDGGTVDCHAGTATSVEHKALPDSAFSSTARSTPGAHPSGSPSGRSSSPVSSDVSRASDAPSAVSGSDVAAGTKSSGGGGHGGGAVVWILVAVAVVAGAGVAVWRWRRTNAS
jgi:hypothetical protein